MRTASANGGRADRKPGARAPQRRSDDEAARQGFHPPALLFATRSPVLRHGTTAVTGRAPTPDWSVVAPARASTPCGTQKKRLVDFIRVRRWSQCSAGKSKKASRASRSFVRQAPALSYLAPYLSANPSIAASVSAR